MCNLQRAKYAVYRVQCVQRTTLDNPPAPPVIHNRKIRHNPQQMCAGTRISYVRDSTVTSEVRLGPPPLAW